MPARAARACLDVAFLHPYVDGSARAVLLTSVHVLAREDVVLPEVGPLQVTRYADGAEGAVDLATLIGVLTRRRIAVRERPLGWRKRNFDRSRGGGYLHLVFGLGRDACPS